MGEVFSKWADLINQPIGNKDVEYFTDGNSFVWVAHTLPGMWW
jgi:hypothetical protein